jgi:hypothetical protein
MNRPSSLTIREAGGEGGGSSNLNATSNANDTANVNAGQAGKWSHHHYETALALLELTQRKFVLLHSINSHKLSKERSLEWKDIPKYVMMLRLSFLIEFLD